MEMLEDQVNRDKLRIRELEKRHEKEVQEIWDQVRALQVTVRDQDKKIAEYSQKKQETVVIVNPSKVLDQKYVRQMAKTQVLIDNIPGLFLIN
jgi:hypothetical protein